jgi:hypothetical protein
MGSENRKNWKVKEMTKRTSDGDDWDVDIRRANSGRNHILNTPPETNGWLGNPHRITEEESSERPICPTCEEKHTREEAIRLYEEILRAKLRFDLDFMESFEQLYGKTLRSHCGTQELCHGDVIIKILRERENSIEGGSPS